MRRLIALAALLVLAPAAAAGSAEEPEMTDPVGDTAAAGAVPLPAGQDDVDILAAWFEGETPSSVELMLQMGGPRQGRPNTQWVQEFDAGGKSFAAGFADFSPFFTGAFFCEVEAGSFACIDAEGSFDDAMVHVTIPKANLTDATSITITGGVTFSVLFVPNPITFLGTGVSWDQSPEGIAYELDRPGANETTDKNDNLAVTVGSGNSASSGAGSSIRKSESSGNSSSTSTSTPGAGVLAALGALAAVAVLASRRR